MTSPSPFSLFPSLGSPAGDRTVAAISTQVAWPTISHLDFGSLVVYFTELAQVIAVNPGIPPPTLNHAMSPVLLRQLLVQARTMTLPAGLQQQFELLARAVRPTEEHVIERLMRAVRINIQPGRAVEALFGHIDRFVVVAHLLQYPEGLWAQIFSESIHDARNDFENALRLRLSRARLASEPTAHHAVTLDSCAGLGGIAASVSLPPATSMSPSTASTPPLEGTGQGAHPGSGDSSSAVVMSAAWSLLRGPAPGGHLGPAAPVPAPHAPLSAFHDLVDTAVTLASRLDAVVAEATSLGLMAPHSRAGPSFSANMAPPAAFTMVTRRPAPLSEDERAQLMAAGACLKCRRPGHHARDCPGDPSRDIPPSMPRRPAPHSVRGAASPHPTSRAMAQATAASSAPESAAGPRMVLRSADRRGGSAGGTRPHDHAVAAIDVSTTNTAALELAAIPVPAITPDGVGQGGSSPAVATADPGPPGAILGLSLTLSSKLPPRPQSSSAGAAYSVATAREASEARGPETPALTSAIRAAVSTVARGASTTPSDETAATGKQALVQAVRAVLDGAASMEAHAAQVPLDKLGLFQ